MSSIVGILLNVSPVQNNAITGSVGGASRAGFVPGVSGNPGGRPKGLTRRVRQLVGHDGEAIAEFMFEVMTNETVRTSDRMEAGRWLADRGFGRAVESVKADSNEDSWSSLVRELETEDLEALISIMAKYQPVYRPT